MITNNDGNACISSSHSLFCRDRKRDRDSNAIKLRVCETGYEDNLRLIAHWLGSQSVAAKRILCEGVENAHSSFLPRLPRQTYYCPLISIKMLIN